MFTFAQLLKLQLQQSLLSPQGYRPCYIFIWLLVCVVHIVNITWTLPIYLVNWPLRLCFATTLVRIVHGWGTCGIHWMISQSSIVSLCVLPSRISASSASRVGQMTSQPAGGLGRPYLPRRLIILNSMRRKSHPGVIIFLYFVFKNSWKPYFRHDEGGGLVPQCYTFPVLFAFAVGSVLREIF